MSARLCVSRLSSDTSWARHSPSKYHKNLTPLGNRTVQIIGQGNVPYKGFTLFQERKMVGNKPLGRLRHEDRKRMTVDQCRNLGGIGLAKMIRRIHVIPSQQKRATEPAALLLAVPKTLLDQRLENWKLLRALALPYFFRSTTRLSRVRKPAAFRAPRRAGS
jgi:hypothetical protein